jgi:hypothetical protein
MRDGKLVADERVPNTLMAYVPGSAPAITPLAAPIVHPAAAEAPRHEVAVQL